MYMKTGSLEPINHQRHKLRYVLENIEFLQMASKHCTILIEYKAYKNVDEHNNKDVRLQINEEDITIMTGHNTVDVEADMLHLLTGIMK